ncbi:MAG: AAA family ATPase [Candidatus Omnitrophota bacterium]|jgi:recombinational DNA repair ATPase RecF
MIKIESITIREFRGIRELTLDFKEKNFAVCGPNGTGKSGIVDALEFALTGNVTRLSGEGMGEVSVKQHAPHVDKRNDPEKARVSLKITIPSLNKTVTIERNVKTPTSLLIVPSEPAVINVLRQVEQHPEFVLSRRQLIRYVIATPGKRAEEVRALLHLDQIEQVRAAFQKLANSYEKQVTPLDVAVTQARANLMQALGVTELTQEKVLMAVNTQRAFLGLSAITDLIETTSFKDGMATPGPTQPQPVAKTQILADIQAAREAVAELTMESSVLHVSEAKKALEELVADPIAFASVKKETFYTTGFELIENETCPFCDVEWNPDKLKKRIQEKMARLQEIAKKRDDAENKIIPLIESLEKADFAISALARYAALTGNAQIIQAATDFKGVCKSTAERLANIVPLADTITVLSKVAMVPKGVFEAINELEKIVNKLPEPTKQDAARDWLTIAQERLEVERDAVRKRAAIKAIAQRTRQVLDVYTSTSDKVLTSIYEAVEKDFSSLYSSINSDDEEKFKAKLIPSMGKLGFDVEFYGRGFFPPGAYHSEGHQDSMGLCLYLALMKHLQGAGFTFAVLDDVLMSVDAGHRREVCTLLKKEFPNTQFIMTTHDSIWLRHMRTEGLIGSRAAVQFRTWNVDQGPTRWDGADLWGKISEYLNSNDVRAAAALLRHYLEYESWELCHRLRAPVEFRGDAQYQLGELLPAAVGRLKDLYRLGKNVANSWKQQDVFQQLEALDKAFSALVTKTNVEQWQVNAAVHYNSWENLTKNDFQPVVTAYHELLDGFGCPTCAEYFRVSPDRESPDGLRCGCAKTNINLKRKPAQNSQATSGAPAIDTQSTATR